jgi:hypothetical protein
MKKPKLEKFGLSSIQTVLANTNSDVETARKSLAFAVGASVDISGKVQKRVKREGQCKLVIEPSASVLGFIVFADFSEQSDLIKKAKIRKGSSVRVKGKLLTFGASAVCLSDCRLERLKKE